MTPEERQAARARCDAASPAPWEWFLSNCDTGRMCIFHKDENGCIGEQWIADDIAKEDSDFIAHARTDLPAALDALDAKDAEIEQAREALSWLANRFDWGVSEPVAHHYQEAIAMLLFGPAKGWAEALSIPARMTTRSPRRNEKPLSKPCAKEGRDSE